MFDWMERQQCDLWPLTFSTQRALWSADFQWTERCSLAFRHSRDHERTWCETFYKNTVFHINRCDQSAVTFYAPPQFFFSQILNLLTEQEVISVVPTRAIVPRTFVLKPSMSLFVGGIARIDFLQVTWPSLPIILNIIIQKSAHCQ